MKTYLTEQERTRLDLRVAEAEQRTGAQIVLAVVERSDVYAELPWKAFALGAGAAGLTAVLLDLLRAAWVSPATVLLAVTAVLVTGAAAALCCVLAPGFARLFLDRTRAEVETRQYAESLFLSREIFATRGRTGILVLVSLFERAVIVLPDAGLGKRLQPDALQTVVDTTTQALAGGAVGPALEAGLAALEQRLAASAQSPVGGNELPNTIVEGGRS